MHTAHMRSRLHGPLSHIPISGDGEYGKVCSCMGSDFEVEAPIKGEPNWGPTDPDGCNLLIDENSPCNVDQNDPQTRAKLINSSHFDQNPVTISGAKN